MPQDFLLFFLLDSSNLSGDLFSNLDPISIIVLVLIGFAVGVSIGIAGFGITPILVPSLILMGLTPHLIVGTVLMVTFLTKGFATIVHGRIQNINWRVVLILFVPVIPSMLLASWTWIYVEENFGSKLLDILINLLLGIVLFGVGWYMIRNFFQKKTQNSLTEPQSHRTEFIPITKAIMMTGSVVVSFITQITSAGAGPMFLPMITKLLRSPKYSAGTLTIMGLVVSLVGAILHYNFGMVNLLLVILLFAGSIPGVILGIRLNSIIESDRLIVIFVLLSILAALFLFGKAASLLI